MHFASRAHDRVNHDVSGTKSTRASVGNYRSPFPILINFGGTMTLSTAKATMGSEVALVVGRAVARFPSNGVEGDILLTAGWATEPFDAMG